MERVDCMQQIIDVAKKNGNHVSYIIVMDILKDAGSNWMDTDFIENVLDTLTKEGIVVEQGEITEDYMEVISSDSNRFIPADVHIISRNMTIDAIVERLKYDEIELQPEFQRKAELWTNVQQSRLIESLMLKIPIPTFYFNAVNDDKWVVIDGLQRLTALKNFMVKKSLELNGLEYLNEFNGCKVDDLPRQYYRRIRESQIPVYTIEKGTPEEIVYNIFKRINTGGLHLEPQEIRHALYQGESTRLVCKMAKSPAFLDVTSKKIKTDRMQDCEFVTRYIAFTELDYSREYTGSIDDFLIKALKHVNNYSDEQRSKLELEFTKIMKVCLEIFGKYAFRKVSLDGKRGPINKAVFEMWCVCLHSCSEAERDKLLVKKDIVMEKFINLLQNKEMINAIKSSDRYSVCNRIAMLDKLIWEILNG